MISYTLFSYTVIDCAHTVIRSHGLWITVIALGTVIRSHGLWITVIALSVSILAQAILLRALAQGRQYWLVQCGGRDIRRAFGWLWSPESCTAGWEQDLLESSFAQAVAS